MTSNHLMQRHNLQHNHNHDVLEHDMMLMAELCLWRMVDHVVRRHGQWLQQLVGHVTPRLDELYQ